MTDGDPGPLLALAQVGFVLVVASMVLGFIGAAASSAFLGVLGVWLIALPILVPVGAVLLYALVVMGDMADTDQQGVGDGPGGVPGPAFDEDGFDPAAGGDDGPPPREVDE